MKFKISRRKGRFIHSNFRGENHGKEKVPAADMKIRFPGTKRDIDMLMPLQHDMKMSDVLYDNKGNLQAGYLSPMTVFRKPSDVAFVIWDRPTSEKDRLEFECTTVKDIKVDLNDKRNIMINLSVQLHDNPEKHTARIRRLLDEEREFSLEAMQEDFFDEPPEEGEEDPKQGKLDVAEEQDEEEENGEDEDTE